MYSCSYMNLVPAKLHQHPDGYGVALGISCHVVGVVLTVTTSRRGTVRCDLTKIMSLLQVSDLIPASKWNDNHAQLKL